MISLDLGADGDWKFTECEVVLIPIIILPTNRKICGFVVNEKAAAAQRSTLADLVFAQGKIVPKAGIVQIDLALLNERAFITASSLCDTVFSIQRETVCDGFSANE